MMCLLPNITWHCQYDLELRVEWARVEVGVMISVIEDGANDWYGLER